MLQCLTPIAPPPPEGCAGVGDVNSDGSISVLDLVAISNFILGITSLPGDSCTADVDGNGTVNVSVSQPPALVEEKCIPNSRLFGCG